MRSPVVTDLRSQRRLVAITAGGVVLAGAISLFHTGPAIQGWSIGTAYAGMLLLAISLSLGPLNVLRRLHNPVHSSLRRDVGIAAGITGILHTILGLQVHMRGALSAYFGLPVAAPLKSVLFVTTNWLGLISAAVLAVLVGISNNQSVKTLGLPRWKRLQRLAYLAAGAILVHGFLYEFLESRVLIGVLTTVGSAAAVVILQVKGAQARREHLLTRQPSLPDAPRR